MWFTMTPLEEPWVAELLWNPAMNGDRDDVSCHELWTEHNPHIPRAALESVSRNISSDEEREARLYGRYRHLQGRVLPEFDPRHHVIAPFEIPPTWNFIEAIDPHPSKPHSIVFAAVGPDHMIYIYDECEVTGHVDAIAEAILTRRKRKPAAIVCDISHLMRSGNFVGMDLRQNLSARIGNFQPAAKYPGSDIDGIDMVRKRLTDTISYLAEPDANKRDHWKFQGIQIFNTCRKTINQIKNYVWDQPPKNRRGHKADDKIKPLKRNDDFVDCVRYICALNPKFGQIAYKPVKVAKTSMKPKRATSSTRRQKRNKWRY